MSRPLSPEARDLAARHLPLAEALARRLAARYGIPADESLSAAHLGLCLAARDFDPSQGNRFVTPAWRVIRGAIIDDIRRARGRGRSRAKTVPLDDPGALVDGPNDAPECGWDDLMVGLPPAWRETLRLLYVDPEMEGRNDRVAAHLGMSRHGVSLRRRQALEFLRERLGVAP